MVIYNNINVFLKNFPVGITAFGAWLDAKAVDVAEQLQNYWQCNSNPGNNFLSENNQNGS